MTDPRATAAAARIHERAPDLADEPTERLVRDYLDAAEPHDLATLSADDVAGAVIAILRLGRDRPPGGRVVAVANPTRGAGRLGLPSHRGRRRHRRRPVPRRQRQRGAGAARLRPPPAAPPVARAPRRRYDVASARRDRPRDRSGGAGRPRPRGAFGGRRRVRGGRGLGRDARAGRRARPRAGANGHRPTPIPPTWRRRRRTWPGSPTTTSRSSPRREVDVDGDVVPGSELGVARRRALFREHEPADPTDGWLLSLTKSLQHSTVHRAVPLDCVDVRRFGPTTPRSVRPASSASTPRTSTASRPRRSRCCAARSRRCMARSGLTPSSHDGRALAHVLETYPRDELFRLVARRAGRARARHRRHGAAPPRAALRQPRPERLFRVVPRVPAARPVHDDRRASRWSTRCDARSTGSEVDFTVLRDRVGDGAPARRREHTRRRAAGRRAGAGGRAGGAGARVGRRPARRVRRRAGRGGRRRRRTGTGCDAFPAAYQFEVDADDAVADVAVLEALDPGGDLEIRLEPPVGGSGAHQALPDRGRARALRRDAAARAPRRDRGRRAPVRDRRAGRHRRGGSTRSVCAPRRAIRSAIPTVQARVAERLPRGVGGHDRERRAEPAGAPGRPRRARRRDRARALPVPASGRRALHRCVPRRHARGEPGAGAPDRRAVPPAPRPRAAARSGRRGRASSPSSGARSTRWPASTPTGSCARSWQRRAGGGAHERVPEPAVPGVQVRPAGARLPAPAPAAARDLGVVAPRWRACTCAPATSRAAASAGPTGGRTSAPRSSV